MMQQVIIGLDTMEMISEMELPEIDFGMGGIEDEDSDVEDDNDEDDDDDEATSTVIELKDYFFV